MMAEEQEIECNMYVPGSNNLVKMESVRTSQREPTESREGKDVWNVNGARVFHYRTNATS